MKDLKAGVQNPNSLMTFKNLTPEYESISKVKNHQQGVLHPSNIVAKSGAVINAHCEIALPLNIPVENSSRETFCETLYLNTNQLVNTSINQLLSKSVIANTIIQNQRFISDTVSDALKTTAHLMIKSDMGTGKTEAQLNIIEQATKGAVVVVVTVHRSLVKGNKKRLETGLALRSKSNTAKEVQQRLETGLALRNLNRHVLHYEDATLKTVETADVISTTVNSFPHIMSLIEQANRPLYALVLDESESIAQFMTAHELANKQEVADALLLSSLKAKHVILGDAHLGSASYAFAAAYLGNLSFTLLENQFKPWSGFTYDILEGEALGIGLITDLLEQGKRLFITCTSKQQANKLHQKLKALGLLKRLKVLKAFETKLQSEDESLELAACKENHALFNQYDLVIASPTVGVGISIEPEQGQAPRFDRVISFMTRHKEAPDALGALQMPFRVRMTKDKHLDLVFIDHASHGKPLLDWQIRQDLKCLIQQYELVIHDFHGNDLKQAQYLSNEARRYSTFKAALQTLKVNAFDDYFDIIQQHLEAKGLSKRQSPDIQAPENLKEVTKAIREDEQATHLQALTDAPLLTDKQVHAIELKKLDRNHRTSQSDQLSLEKHYLMQAYHDGEQHPTLDQLATYLKHQKEGIAAGRNALANAQLTRPQIRLAQYAFMADSIYKRDITNPQAIKVKATWEIDRILCKMVGLAFNETKQAYEFNNLEKVIDSRLLTEKIDGHSIVRRISEHLDVFNATNPDRRINRKALHDNPLNVVIKLLKNRFKLRLRKLTNTDAYVLEPEQTVLDNLNLAHKRGVFGLMRVVNAMESKQVLDENGKLSPDTCKRLNIDGQVKAFITQMLEKIPTREHKNVVAQYVRIAETEHKAGEQFTPVARANLYLHDVLDRMKKAA